MKKKPKHFSIEEQRRHKEIKRMFNYFSQEPTFYSPNTKKNLDDYDQNPEREGISYETLPEDEK